MRTQCIEHNASQVTKIFTVELSVEKHNVLQLLTLAEYMLAHMLIMTVTFLQIGKVQEKKASMKREKRKSTPQLVPEKKIFTSTKLFSKSFANAVKGISKTFKTDQSCV